MWIRPSRLRYCSVVKLFLAAPLATVRLFAAWVGRRAPNSGIKQLALVLLAGLLAVGGCGGAKHSATQALLTGHWQLVRTVQRVHRASGEVAQVIRQTPPQASERFLDVTNRELISQHEQLIATKLSRYSVARTYQRKGNTLFVYPVAGSEALPMTIKYLAANSLIIYSVTPHKLGTPYTEVRMYYTR